jgi:hypothetical protein
MAISKQQANKDIISFTASGDDLSSGEHLILHYYRARERSIKGENKIKANPITFLALSL